MASLLIDNQRHEVPDGQNLLQACLSLGYDLPYFCWHPALGSVGACRQCAVKIFEGEDDSRGRIVMACMTPATDGARLSIRDPEAVAFRKAVAGWLMTNHPHDCPVCDEGGECHLQDMTVMTGQAYRTYRHRKRTFRNQDLGPCLHHEMNRCIQCHRCVRFYQDVAGGDDLVALASRNRTYFGRAEPGPLKSPFAGNLVEICPTGVFTDKTFREHSTRKWDLQTTPSLCVHCSLGCNLFAGERHGTVRRVLDRYHPEVNGFFLCDRGRFGYEHVHSRLRLRQPLLRGEGEGRAEPVSRRSAVAHVADLVDRGKRVVGIGSPRASLESNHLLRTLVGPDRFSSGMSPSESLLVSQALALLRGPARALSLAEAARSDAVLILGEDVIHTAPLLALALRQVVHLPARQRAEQIRIPAWDAGGQKLFEGEARGPLFVASPAATWLDRWAQGVMRRAPDDIARLGFAVAHLLDSRAPAVPDLPDDDHLWAVAAANLLMRARRPLVIAGTGCRSQAVLQSAANVAWALRCQQRDAGIVLALPACNSAGVGLMGGLDLGEVQALLDAGEADTLIVIENDLTRAIGAEAAERLLAATSRLVVLDHHAHPTVERADVVLPVGTFAESSGTLVNNEGRAQRFFQALPPGVAERASWSCLQDLLLASRKESAEAWMGLREIASALARELPVFTPLVNGADPTTRIPPAGKIPRQPHRFSGRTALHAHVDVQVPRTPEDTDTPLAYSMEGWPGSPSPGQMARIWAPGWNSVQALLRFHQRAEPTGDRLLSPSNEAEGFFVDVPRPFVPVAGKVLLVPFHHVFGGEELSSLAPAVAARAPGPYLAVGTRLAEQLGLVGGGEVTVSLGDRKAVVALRLSPDLPPGLAGWPAGQAGLPHVALPRWTELEPS